LEQSDNPVTNHLREPFGLLSVPPRGAPRGQIGAAGVDLERGAQDKAMSGNATGWRCNPNGGYRVALRAFEGSYAVVTKT